MLDQNTDRMWYVIGAVIVGAALIFLMNGAFPTLFANVGTTFEEKVGETTELVEDIHSRPTDGTQTDGVGPMTPDKVVKTAFQMKSAVPWEAAEYTWLSDTSIAIRADAAKVLRGGLRIPAEYFTTGEQYTISFDMTKVSGDIAGLGGHVFQFDPVDVYIDGKAPVAWEHGYSNSGENRWSASVVYPNDTQKHRVEVTFIKTNTDTTVDNNVYIQPNRAADKAFPLSDYEVLIENVEIYQHKK